VNQHNLLIVIQIGDTYTAFCHSSINLFSIPEIQQTGHGTCH